MMTSVADADKRHVEPCPLPIKNTALVDNFFPFDWSLYRKKANTATLLSSLKRRQEAGRANAMWVSNADDSSPAVLQRTLTYGCRP